MTETASDPSTPGSGPPGWVLAALAALLAYAGFVPALDGAFTNWDDQVNFTDNLKYRGLGAEQLKYFFTDYAGHYMPVTWLTLGLDYVLYGMKPRGYHATSMLFHAATAFVFFFVLRTLFRKALPDASPRGAGWGAFAGTLFFALHPLRAESVAWITERRDVVSGLFFMLTVLAYLRFAGAEGSGRRKWMALCAGGYLLMLLSKFMAMTLPVALLALDVWPLRRWTAGRGGLRAAWPLVREKALLFVLMTSALIATVAVQRKATALYDRNTYPVSESITQPPYRVGFYVAKTLVPAWLSPIYPYRPTRLDPHAWKYAVAWVAWVAAAVMLYRLRRRRPELAVAFFVYAVLIAPVSGVFQAGPHFAADRYSYFACLPFAALAGGWAAAWGPGRPAVGILTAAVLALLAGLNWRQAGIWKDSYALWDHAIRVGSPSPIPWVSRGDALRSQKKYPEAMADFLKAAEIDPNERMAWDNISDVHRRLGRLDKALEAADRSVRVAPRHPSPWVNRAKTKFELKDYAGAAEDFTKALELSPGSGDLLLDRALARRKSHDLDGAIADATAAMALDPRVLKPYLDRAGYRMARRDFDGALQDYAAAHRLDPRQPEPLVARALEHAQAGDEPAAMADLARAIEQNPGSARAHSERGSLRARRGDPDGALQDLERARELDPAQLPPHFARALARSRSGDAAGAFADYTEAIRRNPREAAAYGNRGLLRVEKDDWAGALADYSEALRIEPRYLDAWVNRAGLHGRLGKHPEAIADAEEALRINPKSHEALTYRGTAKANLKDFEGAIADLETALREAPKDWHDRKNVEAVLGQIRRSRSKQSR